MARKDTREVATAEWYDDQKGTTISGTVVKQNGSTVYVRWDASGRVEPVSRRDPRGVVFKTADES